MPEIEIRGEKLYYDRKGSGQTLVLVHSLGPGAWLWREQIEQWSNRFDVIAFDVRGHGRSTNRGGVSTHEIARDIRAALRELGLAQAHCLGISMGGPILARLHEVDATLIQSLVLAGSFATQGAAGAQRAQGIEERVRTIGIREFARGYADETILPSTPRPHHAQLVESIGAMEEEAYLQTVRSVFGEDVSEQLRSIRVPCLVVVGEQDSRTPPPLSEQIADLVSGASLRRIPNAAHLANLDNPLGFYGAVTPFLEEQARG